MDNFKGKSRRNSQHYSDYNPNDSTKELNNHQSKSNSESPKFVRQHATFECKVCLNTYQSKNDLNHHLYTAQHLRPLSRLKPEEVVENIPSRKRKYPGFVCRICDDEFNSHTALKVHLNKAGHHLMTNREKYLSQQDKDTYDSHEKYSDRKRHHSSSIDATSESSFILLNGELNDTEESRGKSSSLSVRSSGSSDVIMEDCGASSQNDNHSRNVLVGGFDKSSPEDDFSVTREVRSSNQLLDNNQLVVITSPDDSFPLQSKMAVEVSSTSENHKSWTLIPTETHFPTLDPRQSSPCDVVEKQSKKTNAKVWKPIYQDRPTPKFAEQRIPWKLIPIDFSSLKDSKKKRSDDGCSATSPPGETSSSLKHASSIDNLAAQLKENTGATFIPPLQLAADAAHSPLSLENSCISHNKMPSQVSSTSTSEDRSLSPSSTPCLDEDESIEVDEKRNSVINLEGNQKNRISSLLARDHWHPDSTSGSPYSPKCDHPSSPDRTAITQVPYSRLPLLHKPIPPPVVDHKVDAAILEDLGSLLLTPKPCTNPLLPSSQWNTHNLNAPNTSKFAVEENSELEVATDSPFPISDRDQDSVESRLSEIFGHAGEIDAENVTSCDSFKCSSNSSLESTVEPEEPWVTDGGVETCLRCPALLGVKDLIINMLTGNCSTSCRSCGLSIVMKGAYKKKL